MKVVYLSFLSFLNAGHIIFSYTKGCWAEACLGGRISLYLFLIENSITFFQYIINRNVSGVKTAQN
jgi:hypothetical protein